MVDFEIKDCYKFDDLLRIMEILRAPDGCMWDREQDHHSIRRNFIEETYEVCEAIDDEDTEHMKEELGDVLLQVVFHTQMEKEKGTFDIDDVADGICKKLMAKGFSTYSHENVIIVAPPLIITPEQLREEMQKLDEVLGEVDAAIAG